MQCSEIVNLWMALLHEFCGQMKPDIELSTNVGFSCVNRNISFEFTDLHTFENIFFKTTTILSANNKAESCSIVRTISISHANLPYLISGTVIELSAMFVDRMILRNPSSGLWNTRDCSVTVIEEWRGIKVNLSQTYNTYLII